MRPPGPTRLTRRTLLGAGLLGAGMLGAAGCAERAPAPAPARWVGASQARGHRLRAGAGAPAPAGAPRRADVLVLGGGIAGLAAARALRAAGVEDIAVLELEDGAGGNSRAHAMGGLRCPLGAHYLPVPGPAAEGVREWLHELGLLHERDGRSVPDERHLAHSPQERLFIDEAWHEGLLPPAAPGSATLRQYRAFARAVAQAQRLGFAVPTHRAPWTPAHAALDGERFSDWLARQGLDDERLRWTLDYACRDDYGAGLDTVSAWAGLHYFASRHGFQAPGDEAAEAAEHDAVFTWPEGNAWLAERLAAPLGDRLRPARVVTRVELTRHAVQVQAWDAAAERGEAWQARAAVLALPLFIAARVLAAPPPALAEAAPMMRYAPWLVANLQLREPLLDRGIGAHASWDNVRYGSPALGYVDAGHQRLSPQPGPTVLTAYWALPQAERAALLQGSAGDWARRVLDDLQPLHPDLPDKLQAVDLMRYGHAMAIPVPGLRASPALAALAGTPAAGQRLHFAHADLSAHSVFEEAFEHGLRAGRAAAAVLRQA